MRPGGDPIRMDANDSMHRRAPKQDARFLSRARLMLLADGDLADCLHHGSVGRLDIVATLGYIRFLV